MIRLSVTNRRAALQGGFSLYSEATIDPSCPTSRGFPVYRGGGTRGTHAHHGNSARSLRVALQAIKKDHTTAKITNSVFIAYR